jgi:hypothetical protein
LVLGADDPVAAAATLQARGQTVEETDAGRFQVTAFGTRFLIEASDSVD